jgi:uncharacterized membrane protein
VTGNRSRLATLWLMAIFYAGAGVLHLRAPQPFLAIVPDWVPQPRAVVMLTGLCEIAGALGLLIPRLRHFAGAMLALYALCVFPANIKHAVYDVQVPGLPTGLAYHIPRLALQPVLIWWALYCSGVIDWPLRRRAASPP